MADFLGQATSPFKTIISIITIIIISIAIRGITANDVRNKNDGQNTINFSDGKNAIKNDSVNNNNICSNNGTNNHGVGGRPNKDKAQLGLPVPPPPSHSPPLSHETILVTTIITIMIMIVIMVMIIVMVTVISIITNYTRCSCRASHLGSDAGILLDSSQGSVEGLL